MDAYLVILFVVHIGGAIVGIGPTFAFSVLGPNVGKAGANGGAAILRSMLEIEHKLVNPVALVTQPLSGVLLIIKTNRHENFFKHEWLWTAIILYATILALSYGVNTPASKRMLAWMDSPGGPSGPPPAEIAKDIATTQKLGPLFGVLAVIIIILMIWKPGGYS